MRSRSMSCATWARRRVAALGAFLEWKSDQPRIERASTMNEDLINARAGLAQSRAHTAFLITCFGDHVAQQEGYKSTEGLEAIYIYLIRKHHWLPRDVRAMSLEDLELALHVELQDWTPPEAVRKQRL